MTEAKKKTKFWRIYCIVFGVLLALTAVFFAVFFDIMAKFEESRPDTAAQVFLDSLTEEDFEKLIADASADADSLYTDRDTVVRAFRQMLSDGELTLKKDYQNYTSDNPVFTVSRGNVLLYRITQGKGEAIGYGFTAWAIEKAEPLLSMDMLETKSAFVSVPKGAVLCANGMEVNESPTETGIYRYVSKWESCTSLECEYYTIPCLSDATFTCTLYGTVCEPREEADGLCFLYPNKFLNSYTVEVPAGTTVTVNGHTLTEEDIAERDLPYTPTETEAGRANLPTALRYEIRGLTAEPDVSAELEGHTIPLTREENSFVGVYPEELMYSVSIRVPAGSVVTVNGAVCSAKNITATESESEELFDHGDAVPSYEIYTLEGLFLAPDDIRVMYNEQSLPLTAESDGRTYTVSASFPALEDPLTEELALRFLKDYFIYTSYGSSNTDANIARVLSYIPSGIPLYNKIVQSKPGFAWITPVLSMTYNTLETESVYAYPNNYRLCHAKFDITQTYYGGVIREYRGTMKVMINEYGAVVGMEIDTDA